MFWQGCCWLGGGRGRALWSKRHNAALHLSQRDRCLLPWGRQLLLSHSGEAELGLLVRQGNSDASEAQEHHGDEKVLD